MTEQSKKDKALNIFLGINMGIAAAFVIEELIKIGQNCVKLRREKKMLAKQEALEDLIKTMEGASEDEKENRKATGVFSVKEKKHGHVR